MRCKQCKRNKVESLMDYGGVLLCPVCYDERNPLLHTVKLLPDDVRERLESKRWMLEKELRALKYQLEVDDKIRKSGSDQMTFRTPRH